MTRETLPDFSGVYADEFELRERAKEQGFVVVYGCRLFGRKVLHVERAEDERQKGVYLMKYLPGGLVYLTDEHIGRNALRFEGELGGAR